MIVDTFPTSANEFLEFSELDIYGFTMHQFPNLDGIVAMNTTSADLVFCDLDSTTYKPKT